MDFDVAFMLQAFLAALHYLPTTLLLGFLPLLFGSVFGFGIALIRFYQVPVLSPLFKWFVAIFKAIPVVLILLVSYLLFLIRWIVWLHLFLFRFVSVIWTDDGLPFSPLLYMP
ncbi:hypothetical protein ACVNSY_18130 [Bacillus sp. OHL2]